MTHGRLRQQGAIQWPCPLEEVELIEDEAVAIECETQGNISQNQQQQENSGLFSNLFRSKEATPVAKRLYTDRIFNTPDGRARFAAFHAKGLAEPPNNEYPFVLTVGRLYEHWHTMTRTGRIAKIMKKQPSPFLEIHPKDAARLGIEEGVMVEVRSRRGKARFTAKITKAIAPGTVFAPMHWGALWAENAEANILTHSEACPISLEPELKACAVKLIPVANLELTDSTTETEKLVVNAIS